MLFNSFDFLVFFPFVVAIYFVIPKRVRYIWLLIASYYFYMSWNAKYALLIAFSTCVTWLSGILLGRANQYSPTKLFNLSVSTHKKIIVAGSLLINLGILAFFKYYDFILHNINVTMAVFSIEPFEKPFDLLLPVGISFYTFQALSYTIDVYRGDVPVEKNILKYGLFVSFFPQLVAGPIERSSNLLRQVNEAHHIKLWNLNRVTQGCILMLWGYFLKMVLADRAAIIVNSVYNSFWLHNSCELSIATLFFAFQILCDFAGYSTIAIGAAKVMGFDLMKNFSAPYFSKNIQEFWRKWHISLSSWFRDYLYIPLGGSRCSKLQHYRNIMIVFVVSGIWHGASWSFVIWGFLHGFFQIIGLATKPFRNKLYKKHNVKTDAFSWKLLQIALTFFLVCIAWIFFRANSVPQALTILGTIFTTFSLDQLSSLKLSSLGISKPDFIILMISIVALFLVDLLENNKKMSLDVFLEKQNFGFRWVVMLALVAVVFLYGVYGTGIEAQKFIYFQF